ncbi:MAG: hypothetical protein AB7G93_06650 [Bdellovibrionales bacterium]
MRTKTKLPMLLFLFTFTLSARANKIISPEQFLQATGLIVGDYKAYGPSSCREGTLDVFMASKGELTLMLGAHPLIMGLRRGKAEVERPKDRCCVSKLISSYGNGVVNGQKIQTCEPDLNRSECQDIRERVIVVHDTEVRKRPDGFQYRYRRTIYPEGKVDHSETCILRPAPPEQ